MSTNSTGYCKACGHLAEEHDISSTNVGNEYCYECDCPDYVPNYPSLFTTNNTPNHTITKIKKNTKVTSENARSKIRK